MNKLKVLLVAVLVSFSGTVLADEVMHDFFSRGSVEYSQPMKLGNIQVGTFSVGLPGYNDHPLLLNSNKSIYDGSNFRVNIIGGLYAQYQYNQQVIVFHVLPYNFIAETSFKF